MSRTSHTVHMSNGNLRPLCGSNRHRITITGVWAGVTCRRCKALHAAAQVATTAASQAKAE